MYPLNIYLRQAPDRDFSKNSLSKLYVSFSPERMNDYPFMILLQRRRTDSGFSFGY